MPIFIAFIFFQLFPLLKQSLHFRQSCWAEVIPYFLGPAYFHELHVFYFKEATFPLPAS